MERADISQETLPEQAGGSEFEVEVPAESQAESQVERINRILKMFAEVLEGFEDYVVFSSTAMYLHGQRLGDRIPGEAWAVPPGDLDVNFFDKEEWERAGKRLKRAGAVIDKEGERLFPGQDIRVISGTLEDYPFEFFLRSDRIIPPQFGERAVEMHGLKVLALEDVKNQYQRNLEFDGRLWREVQKVASALAAAERSPEAFGEICSATDITLAEGHQAVALWDAYHLAGSEEVRAGLEKQLSSLLGGVKTKTEQRRRNLQQLDGR